MSSTQKLTASVSTLGCRVNQYESDAISEMLRENGFEIVPLENGPDAAIINTCAVTGESGRKSRQLIRKAIGINPFSVVIVTGCYSQIQQGDVASIEGVDYICGNGNKSEIPSVAKQLIANKNIINKVNVTDIMEEAYDNLKIQTPSRIRSYIKIEDGCNNRCSYCIIPSARGKVRSKKTDIIFDEINALAKAGCKEIILTGIETASYGFDFKNRNNEKIPLAGLLEKIDALGISRIGLGSLDPNIMSEEFVSRISKLDNILPHFHLSIQSGSSSVLRRMRRKYNAETALERISCLKTSIPDVTLSADIIVGFPGETEKEFNETVEFVQKVEFLHLHIFPYSPRPGTEAAAMQGQITNEIKHKRLASLNQIQKKIKEKLMSEYVSSHTDNPVYVLVEKNENGTLSGHSEHYIEVSFKSDDKNIEKIGNIEKVVLSEQCSDICKGVAIR